MPVELDQKPILRQLIELYNYDFSEFDDGDVPSYLFWETVIGAYTGGRYTKGGVVTEDWEGQAITFDNSN